MSVEALDSSLDRVRTGLERRVAALGARVGDHLAGYVGQPGKLLRTRYTLLLGRALGVDSIQAESVARAVELVHNASLLHDDCIDEGLLRRGVPTPNALFGDRTGILVGDLAFTQGMAEAALVSSEAVRSLVAAVQEMTIGELQEEFLKGSLNVSVEGYYGVAARKTSALFEWAGRVLSDESPLDHRREDPPRLGVAAGVLLQIVDDIHDFTLAEAVAGKPPGQDLHNGRLTLPGIIAMDDDASRERWIGLWGERSSGRLDQALALFKEGGHLDTARGEARRIMTAMLPWAEALPQREAAAELCGFMTALFNREF
ncbi:MAG: polyprenyl synthetase family protein [Elusimicrobia bacterium]|nr:polyprenyl synthetase family protein [Elusimicrobiota bacterium]